MGCGLLRVAGILVQMYGGLCAYWHAGVIGEGALLQFRRVHTHSAVACGVSWPWCLNAAWLWLCRVCKMIAGQGGALPAPTRPAIPLII